MLKAVFEIFADHPWVMLLILAAIALAAQVAIDAAMGDVAEYFNAARVFAAWGELLAGRDPSNIKFMMGQQHLGVLALPAGTLVLLVQPMLYGGILVVLGRLGARLVA